MDKMIETLLGELRSLETQKAEQVAQVHRIEGAEQMIRHLLAKAQATQAGIVANRNGMPSEGQPVEN